MRDDADLRGLPAAGAPWDLTQALSFALFRTYAVPSIGRLLFTTGEFTGRTQKRYDDTVLVLDAVLEHGLASGAGRAAVRRMNQLHHAYEIPDDDLRYVLATFVVSPVRWSRHMPGGPTRRGSARRRPTTTATSVGTWASATSRRRTRTSRP